MILLDSVFSNLYFFLFSDIFISHTSQQSVVTSTHPHVELTADAYSEDEVYLQHTVACTVHHTQQS